MSNRLYFGLYKCPVVTRWFSPIGLAEKIIVAGATSSRICNRQPTNVAVLTNNEKGEIMTTTYRHSAAFNDLAALLTGQFFFLKMLIMNRCANSGMAGEDTTRCDRSVFDCSRCHSYDWTIAGTALSVRGADTKFWTIADREWCGDRSVPDENRHH